MAEPQTREALVDSLREIERHLRMGGGSWGVPAMRQAIAALSDGAREGWGNKSGVLLWRADGHHHEVEHPHAATWLEVLEHPPTQECPDLECSVCGMRDCPDKEPLHYHHDGCPACWQREKARTERERRDE